MNVERLLTERIGDAGKRLHTGRSRNDQVALDFRMYMKARENEAIEKLKSLILALCKIAKANTGTIMPAYTHLQKAQPTTLGHIRRPMRKCSSATALVFRIVWPVRISCRSAPERSAPPHTRWIVRRLRTSLAFQPLRPTAWTASRPGFCTGISLCSLYHDDASVPFL